jgi:hypothetical protein
MTQPRPFSQPLRVAVCRSNYAWFKEPLTFAYRVRCARTRAARPRASRTEPRASWGPLGPTYGTLPLWSADLRRGLNEAPAHLRQPKDIVVANWTMISRGWAAPVLTVGWRLWIAPARAPESFELFTCARDVLHWLAGLEPALEVHGA